MSVGRLIDFPSLLDNIQNAGNFGVIPISAFRSRVTLDISVDFFSALGFQ
jgi:hypothetical protein